MKAPRSLKEFLEDGRPSVVGDFLFLHHVDDNSHVLARISLIECVFKYEGYTRIEFGRYENDYILVKDSLEDVLSAISGVDGGARETDPHKEDPDPRNHFYRDCPLGIHEEEENAE